jgi:peptide subunit release factor 1 (eRF1)
MISHEDLSPLHQYSSGPESLILSLYVDIDQSDAANLNRGFETKIEGLFRQVAENQNSHEGSRQRFEAECQRVREFLSSYIPKGKALVLFSDSKQNFWWQRELHVELPTEARWSPQLWVRPLLEVVERHDRFAVVLIDKQRARILTADAGGMKQQAEILSDVPNKHATTGSDHIWSQGQMERDHSNHVHSHAKRVADELFLIVDRMKVRKIVVGGPVEATTVFIGALPKRLQQMIIGTISAPVEANQDRIISELRAVQAKAGPEDENKVVDAMITAAMKGDRAVIGVADTLFAIQEGRVYRLVVAKDYRIEGKECSKCHVLVTDPNDSCSFCGGKLDAAPDLINRASHRVLDMGGHVQLVAGEAAARLAEAGMGAVLRF